MYSILIADKDDVLLDALKQYFLKFSTALKLHTARNGKDAVRILEMNPVDLVVAELMMPDADGTELFSCMAEKFPFIPIIMTGGFVTPETKKRLKNLGSPSFLNRPQEFDDLKDAIFTKLQQVSGKVTGVSLTSFIQYISLEGKTCLLEAKMPGKKPGRIYFDKGRPWDAIWEDMRGREAAIEIISWQKAEMSFRTIPEKKVKRRITSEVLGLIVEAVRHREEGHIKENLAQDNDVEDSEAAAMLPLEETSSFPRRGLVNEITLENPASGDHQGESVIAQGNALFVLNEEKQAESKIIKPPVLESEGLAGFLNIPSVEAVLVVGNDGAVVHQSSAQAGHIDMEKTGASSALVWNGIIKMGGELGICGFQSLMLESDDAVIVGAPIKDNLLVILARDSKKLGMIRMRMKKQIPELEKGIEKQPDETAVSI